MNAPHTGTCNASSNGYDAAANHTCGWPERFRFSLPAWERVPEGRVRSATTPDDRRPELLIQISGSGASVLAAGPSSLVACDTLVVSGVASP